MCRKQSRTLQQDSIHEFRTLLTNESKLIMSCTIHLDKIVKGRLPKARKGVTRLDSPADENNIISSLSTDLTRSSTRLNNLPATTKASLHHFGWQVALKWQGIASAESKIYQDVSPPIGHEQD